MSALELSLRHELPRRLEGNGLLSRRVLIVDEHKLFAESICFALLGAGIETVELAGSAQEGLESACRQCPDVVLADFCLPDGDGIAMGKAILEKCSRTKVVLMSPNSAIAIHELIQVGFHGFLTKDTPLNEFITAVHLVLAEDQIVTGRVPEVRVVPKTLRDSGLDVRIRHLTRREREVLVLLIQGATGATIAARLSVSPNTVRSHIQSILTKLQVHSRLEAVAFAVRHRVVEMASFNPTTAD